MTISAWEQRLKNVNPAFHIKRYGPNAIAGVHLGNKFILRMPQGETTQFDILAHVPVTEYGETKYVKTLMRRGRVNAACMLHAKQLITYDQRNYLAR